MKSLIRRLLVRVLRRLLLVQGRPYPFSPGATLVVAPHADDETLGCGELIAALAERGLPVAIAFVSDSGADSTGATRRGRATQRRSEAVAAAAELGVESTHLHFFDAPDGELDRLDLATLESTRARLAELLRTFRPERIFVPVLEDGSTEHEAVYWLVREATATSAVVLWEYVVWGWWNPIRLHRQVSHSDQNYFFTTERTRARKRNALECHVSQILPSGHLPLPRDLADACCDGEEFYFRRPQV